MNNKDREDNHKKNAPLESIFPELENILGTSERDVLKRFSKPEKRLFFIIGCARSGSTLLYQYLASTNHFFYPTNFLSRFYYSPYIGYRIQQALIDFDLNGEIFPKINNEHSFNSLLGKTKGPKQPHEFWYFWRRFFKFNETQKLTKEEIESVDWETFSKELHALETVSDKPILMKAMNLTWNLLDLKEKLPNIHFIYIKRDVLYNAQSLLEARKKFFGNINEWYSFKPPNYNDLIKLSPEEQVVEQVIATNSVIKEQLKLLPESEYSVIDYTSFCETPEKIIKDLENKGILVSNSKVVDFSNGNNQKISDKSFSILKLYTKTKGC